MSTSRSVRQTPTDKREAILKAATHVFAQNGYFNSKVSDIARAANIADGTVYLYFKSKEEILHSIFNRGMEELIAKVREQLPRCRDPREKLNCLGRLHLEGLEADRELAIVFQVELRGSTKFMEAFSAAGFAEYLNVIREIIEEGQKTGFFRKDLNPKVCAKVLFGALDEMAMNWILSSRGNRLEPMADVVLDVFLNGVGEKK